MKNSKPLSLQEIKSIYEKPFNRLLFEAHQVHRDNFDPNEIQKSSLLSIKTGSCPEDCAYCPQSAHYDTGVEKEALMDEEDILKAANAAKQSGATRFCLGAAWRSPSDKQVDNVSSIVAKIKDTGLETCATLGMLSESQARTLKTRGLDFYNHNIDSSENFYKKIVTTRKYQDRIDTLKIVIGSGLKTCSGGIVGMGETIEDRLEMLMTLRALPKSPESIPLNILEAIPGTPLESVPALDPLEFVRLIACTRIVFPKSYVRIAAGREKLSDEAQALCYFAGANSVFLGEKLLTAKNNAPTSDARLFEKLDIENSPQL